MSKHRFWPVTPSGAFAVFLAGFMANDLLVELLNPDDGKWLFPAVLVWLTLHHAAETARGSVVSGIFVRGWWGVRTATKIEESVVSPPAARKPM